MSRHDRSPTDVESPLPTGVASVRFRFDWILTALGFAFLVLLVTTQFFDHPALQYTYLGRYPLGIAFVLVAIPFVCGVVAPNMLGNLLSVSPPGQFFLSLLATYLAHVVAMTSQSILVFGPRRYGLEEANDWLVDSWTSIGSRPGEFSPSALSLAAPLVVAGAFASCREGILSGRRPVPLLIELFTATLGGVLVAFGLMWTALPFRDVLDVYLQPRLGGVESFLGPGYVDPSTGRLFVGHVHATAFLAVGVLVYAVAWPLLRPDQRNPVCQWFRQHVPPLAYVLQILVVACWLLAGMSFYLDLYRVPPLLVVGGLSLFCHVVSRADHYWDLIPFRPAKSAEVDEAVEEATRVTHVPVRLEDSGPLPPEAGIDAWLDRQEAGGVSRPTLVVLAVSGGGILSAAWSTLVLGRLAAAYPRLTSSVRLISAVSGGSVGMAYWLEGLRRLKDSGPLPNFDPETARRVNGWAATSSLEATAWGLAFPDLWRVVVPQFPRYDRGWAIEQAWAETLGGPPSTVRSWTGPIRQGVAPAFVFNSTIVESGERFLFSPIRTTDRDPGTGRRFSRTFLRQFPDGDVSLFTAARLSAAFPYVGPNARARFVVPCPDLPEPRQYHFADGGFFDNFGMPTALEWIDTILERREHILDPTGDRSPEHVDRFEKWQKLSRVLLLQLRPFHVSRETPPPFRSGGLSGWTNASLGPLRTLVNIWASTQTARGDAEFELLQKHWTSRGVDVETAVLEYRGPARLSWSLTEADRRALAAGADRYERRRDADAARTMNVLDDFVG